MAEVDNRQIARDSLFVLVELRIDGEQALHRVKMRNLSTGGMMAEGAVLAMRGLVVWINLRNIGWVEGSIAWVQESRFGIAFREEIDPKLARAPQAAKAANDGLLIHRPNAALAARSEGPLRKI
ncbi:PilZ domain-containing protein [Novosphingobium sp.]|uniref:PilZ domain-containing protein n=1 Tax=Novosphingobium sp. TaxID=1874826 RepID=UPI00286E246C|nr:PilZ domain-containing protein [Novosphingobium sp.]